MAASQPVSTFDFIINRRSGAVLQAGENAVRKAIEEGFGSKAGNFHFVDGGEVAPLVADWAVNHAGKNRGLVIGGGDGTVLAAAEQLLGRDDITLGVLPLGTVNGIARKLGFAADFKAAARQYQSGESTRIDVGQVNGMSFLCGLVIDDGNVKVYEAREDLRDKKYMSALRKAFSAAVHLLGRKKSLTVSSGKDSKVFTGRIFAVTPAPLTPQPLRGAGLKLKNILAHMMALGRKNTGTLSFYAIEGGVSLASAAPAIVAGTWTDHSSVRKLEAADLMLQEEGRVEKSLVVDGEIKQTQYPLNVKIIPQGLKVFRPS